MAEESPRLKQALAKWHRERQREKRPFFVDAEATHFKAFLESIEIGDCYSENEHLAIKIIDELKKKYSLIF